MPFPPDISGNLTYANRLDLDKIDVFIEGNGNNPMYFSVTGLPDKLSLGRHYFQIALLDSAKQPYSLKSESKLLFEFKSINDVVLKSDVIGFNLKNGVALCFVEVLVDPLRSFKELKDGDGTLVIAGVLEEKNNTAPRIPQKFKGNINYRCTFPIDIAKNLPNESPILFQSIENIQASSSFSESILADADSNQYNRSYIHISASHLKTFGGRVDKIELSYSEQRSRTDEFKIISTFPLTNSTAFEYTNENTGGLNPISIEEKFPMPREARRKGNINFRLRFLNSAGIYAQDIKNPNTDVIISGSLIITGSPLILETDDNLVTGSGAISFGASLEDSVKMVPDLKAKSVKFQHVVDGVPQKTLLSIEGKNSGKLIFDPEENNISGLRSSGSTILAAENSFISSSELSTIMSSKDSHISQSWWSSIIGGYQSKISFKAVDGVNNDYGMSNVIIAAQASHIKLDKLTNNGSYNAIITGLFNKITTDDNSGGIDPKFTSIIGGIGNQITGSWGSTIIGSYGGKISASVGSDPVGGFSGIINSFFSNVEHHASFSAVIGGNKITASKPNTVYIPSLVIGNGPDSTGGIISASEVYSAGNIKATGDIIATRFITSQSVIHTSSGSNAFGNSSDDTHIFTGSVEISGSTTMKAGTVNFGLPWPGAAAYTGEGTDVHFWGGTSDKQMKWEGDNGTLHLHNDVEMRFGSPFAGFTHRHAIFLDSNTLMFGKGSGGTQATEQNVEFRLGSSNFRVSGSATNVGVDILEGNISASGHITASGDISSSGTISSTGIRLVDGASIEVIGESDNKIELDNGGHKYNAQDGDVMYYNEAGNNVDVRIDGNAGTNFFSQGDAQKIGIGGQLSPSSSLDITGDLRTTSHITASGNISSSGDGGFIGKLLNLTEGDNSNIIFDGDSNLNAVGKSGTEVNFGSGGDWTDVKIGRSAAQPKRIQIHGHITASGNISSSGDIIATGTVSASNFYLTGSGTTVVHMGFTGDSNIGKWEFHRNGIRRHLFYLEGRSNQVCPQDSMVFKSGLISSGDDHIIMHMESGSQTAYFHGNISASGHITASGDIRTHGDVFAQSGSFNVISNHPDSDTRILFTDDDINIRVGDINFMDFTQDSVSELTINENSQNLDVRIEGEADANLFFTDASVSLVGIGTNAPTKKLQVEGDISASGDLHLGQPPHDIGKFSVQHGSPTGSGATEFTTAGEGYGDIVRMSAVTTKPGMIYRFQGNNNWVLADKDSELTGTDMLAVAMGTNSGTDGMLLRGFAHISQSGTIGMANRAFIGDNGVATGSFTNFASGDFVRAIGYMLNAGNSNGSASMYFNPDNTYIEKA